jgi:uncharacterized membrane protein
MHSSSIFNWVIAYVVCFFSFIAIDGVFISSYALKVYKKELGNLIEDKPKIIYGVILYLVYIGAILLYGVTPLYRYFHHSLDGSNFWKILLWGGGIGIASYGVYALTAATVIKGWKAKVAVIDIIWGGIITSIVTLIGYTIVH